MHPALSVVLFTTLSGAGYGLFAWCGIGLAMHLPAQALIGSLILALLFVSAGLLSSFWHLGKPLRAWRAFSQWRSSWLSREAVLAMLTYIPALLLLGLLCKDAIGSVANAPIAKPAVIGTIALILSACAIATVLCTAMIYASLKPIPAWRHALVLPVFLACALYSGLGWLALFASIFAADGLAGGGHRILSGAVFALALLVTLLKLHYWRSIDRAPLGQSRGAAVGLPQRSVSVFEPPHTQMNYVTREMAFALARKHAARLRHMAVALFGGLPMLFALSIMWLEQLPAAPLLGASAGTILLGIGVERWLFFAEARHVVTLYYGLDRSA